MSKIIKFKPKKEVKTFNSYDESMSECISFIKEKTVDIIKIQSSKEESDLSVVKMAMMTYFINKYLSEDDLLIVSDIINNQSEKISHVIKDIKNKADKRYKKHLDSKILPIKGGKKNVK